MKKKFLSYSSSIIFLFLLWIILAAIINADLILPYPKDVFLSLIQLVQKPSFWKAFCFSFLRVISAFIISVILGTALGWLRSISSFLYDFFELPLAIIRCVPVIAIILVALFWFKSDFVPVFVAVLMALPVISTSVTKGFSYENEKLLFMAQTFCFSKKQIFKYIKLPAVLPHFYSGCQSAFGLCWKVVAAGEVISLPKYGFGTIMNKAQVHLETAEVMAVTVLLIIISYSLEKIAQVVFKNGR